MLLLTPKLIILDEIDSGLDVDAIKTICESIMKNKEKDSSLIVITHYPRVLQYFKPSHVHIMIDGQIVESGNLELFHSIEKYGYESWKKKS
jgi:Fe-S cluster assembly ATP-binding protein